MNPQDHIPKPDESPIELDLDGEISVDDFIKELEAKEKDLHITSDLKFEISDCEFEMSPAQEFVERDIAPQTLKPNLDVRAKIPPAVKSRNYELENEIASLKVRVMELKNERSESQEKNDRRLKDFENYKYRMDRERRRSFIDQIANLASQMLPVLDNLNRALDSVPERAESKSPEFEQFFNGIVLVNQQVNEIFAGMGVEPIKVIGASFDPHFHEAVAAEERDDIPTNTIIAELLGGYRIGNRVVRHSMVRVSTGLSTKASSEKTAVSSEPDIFELDLSAQNEELTTDASSSEAE